jgi:hypothetical protein
MVQQIAQRRGFRASHAGVSSRRVQRRKATLEIGLEIVDVLQTDMKPQGRTARTPCGRGPIARTVERDDETFEAAPGKAHAEQIQGVEHDVDGRLRPRFQHDAEQAGSAGEIALPDRVPRIALQLRVQDPCNFRTALQPARHFKSGSVVLREPHRKCAQAPQRREDIVGTGADAEQADVFRNNGPGHGVGGNGSEHDVGMAADIFGRGLQADVGAQFEGAR